MADCRRAGVSLRVGVSSIWAGYTMHHDRPSPAVVSARYCAGRFAIHTPGVDAYVIQPYSGCFPAGISSLPTSTTESPSRVNERAPRGEPVGGSVVSPVICHVEPPSVEAQIVTKLGMSLADGTGSYPPIASIRSPSQATSSNHTGDPPFKAAYRLISCWSVTSRKLE